MAAQKAACAAATHGAVVIPATKQASALCVWLHGLGDSGEGWAPVMKQLSKLLPHCRFVLPHAPVMPVTCNFGMRMRAWHDIKSLEAIEKENFEGLEASRALVVKIIEEESKQFEKPPKVLLGGFSQGAGTSILTGLSYGRPLAGIAVLSGYLPYRKDDLKDAIADAQRKTPIFQAHGASDAVVVPRAGHDCRDRLKAAGMNVEYHEFRGMGHEASEEEIAKLAAFAKKVLG